MGSLEVTDAKISFLPNFEKFLKQRAFSFLIPDNFICATSATSKRAQPIFSKITFLKSLGPMEKNELYLGFIVTKKIKLVLKGGVVGLQFQLFGYKISMSIYENSTHLGSLA